LKKLFLLLNLCLFICLSVSLSAQHRFGVRAGLNYGSLSGELEANENYELVGGFHFGFNYTYQFSPEFGLRGELLYTQRGARQKFRNEDAFHLVAPFTGEAERFYEPGLVDLSLRHTHSYLSIPATVQFQMNERLEIFGGVSLDMLFSPSAGGTMYFLSSENPDDIEYELRLDYNYRRNRAGEIPFGTTGQITSLFVNDERADIFRVRGAYYDFTEAELEERGKRFKFLNASVVLGLNYFLNKGFYVGLRGELGLLDMTNDRMDFSLKDLNDDGEMLERADKDVFRNVALSFGFRF